MGGGDRNVARVLLVGKGPPEHGGIPSFLADIQAGTAARDHDVAMVNLSRPGEPQGGRASVTNLRRTLADARQVWLAAAGRDVVHLHTAFAPGVTALRAGLLALVARARGCAVLLHVHGGRLPLWATTPQRRRVVRLALRPATHVLAVSAAVADTLHDAAPARTRVERLDNGVDVSRFRPAAAAPSRHSDAAPRILYVGLLSPRKGVLDLAEACAELRRRGVSHELHVVGGTPDEGPGAEAEVRAGLPADAVLHGPVAHGRMPAVYREAEVFCLPSWYEAMPLSVLEALASGLPVVATDVGDVSRAVVDGATGRLVRPRHPVDLADALEALLTDPEKRASMGRAGRELVCDRFSADVTQRRLAEVYARLGADRT